MLPEFVLFDAKLPWVAVSVDRFGLFDLLFCRRCRLPSYRERSQRAIRRFWICIYICIYGLNGTFILLLLVLHAVLPIYAELIRSAVRSGRYYESYIFINFDHIIRMCMHIYVCPSVTYACGKNGMLDACEIICFVWWPKNSHFEFESKTRRKDASRFILYCT